MSLLELNIKSLRKKKDKLVRERNFLTELQACNEVEAVSTMDDNDAEIVLKQEYFEDGFINDRIKEIDQELEYVADKFRKANRVITDGAEIEIK